MNRDRRLANYLLLVFGGISLALLSLPITGKVRGLKAMLAYLVDPVPFYGGSLAERFADVPADVLRLITVDVQNRALLQDIKEVELLRAQVESFRRENDRLAAELGIRPRIARAHRWARVLERDPVSWHSSIMIDGGRVEGLEINSPVLGISGAKLGIVGRITEVGEHTSKVLLLTDPLSAAAAYLPSKGWEGLVQGQERSTRLQMNYLPMDAQFSVGDSVFSSPTSATFPPDILIGTISKIFTRDPFLAFQSVEIAPAVSPSILKEVIVLSPAMKAQS